MIKECIVKLNNDVVTVVAYGDVDVQLPAIHKEVNTIFVNYENGKYYVVDKDNKPKDGAAEKKNVKKKTTNKEIAKNLKITAEDSKDA